MIRYPIPSFFTLPAEGVGGGVQSAPHIGRVGCRLEMPEGFCTFAATGLVSCWPEVAGEGFCTFAATGLAASFWLLTTGLGSLGTEFCKSAATGLQGAAS